MSLQATNLLIQMAPLPVTFKGTPNDMFAAAVRRMKILSPGGANFIFIGDVEPTSNVGPWLKGGTKWYVWDEATKRYVPQDISDSFTIPFWIGNSQPASHTPEVWLKTTKDASDVDLSHGDPIGWFMWDSVTSSWVGVSPIVTSGPTASRPTSPEDLQQFYDTDIGTLIWFERAAWRTVSGVKGDVKHVVTEKLADALAQNPGWAFLGDTNQLWRGRTIVGATTDPGTNPVSVFPTSPGVNPETALTVSGETTTLVTGPSSVTSTPKLALWTLYKL